MPNLQLYQYPLLRRPLQVPPSAKVAGKKINSRFKPETDFIEIYIPCDTREDLWNKKQGREYGQHRAEEDGQKAISKEERRLDDLRPKIERIRDRASGIGVISTLLEQLHLHHLHSQRRRGEEEGTLSDEAEEAKPRKEKASEAKEHLEHG